MDYFYNAVSHFFERNFKFTQRRFSHIIQSRVFSVLKWFCEGLKVECKFVLYEIFKDITKAKNVLQYKILKLKVGRSTHLLPLVQIAC